MLHTYSCLVWAGSLLVAAGASASAASAHRRAAAVALLGLTLLILTVSIVLGLLSVGVFFLAPPAVVVAALVRTAQARPADPPPLGTGP